MICVKNAFREPSGENGLLSPVWQKEGSAGTWGTAGGAEASNLPSWASSAPVSRPAVHVVGVPCGEPRALENEKAILSRELSAAVSSCCHLLQPGRNKSLLRKGL